MRGKKEVTDASKHLRSGRRQARSKKLVWMIMQRTSQTGISKRLCLRTDNDDI